MEQNGIESDRNNNKNDIVASAEWRKAFMRRQTSMRDSGRAQTNQKNHYSYCIFLMTTPQPQKFDAFVGSFCCYFHLFYCIFSPARSFFIGFHCIFCVPSRPRIERYCTWSKQNKTTIFVVLLEKLFAHRTLLYIIDKMLSALIHGCNTR